MKNLLWSLFVVVNCCLNARRQLKSRMNNRAVIRVMFLKRFKKAQQDHGAVNALLM
jgi:hypothetical protein